MKPEKCDNCKTELTPLKLTEKEVEQKFNQLVEEKNTIGGLAPKNEPFKHFKMSCFILGTVYIYYECSKCGWWKFKKC